MAELAGAEDLAQALGQAGEEVAVNGKTVIVTPLKTRAFFNILKCVDRLADAGVVKIEGADAEGLKKAVSEFDPLKMVMRGGDELIPILNNATGVPYKDLENLDLATLVRLTAAVWRVNLDFFSLHADEIRESLGSVWETVRSVAGGLMPGLPPLAD